MTSKLTLLSLSALGLLALPSCTTTAQNAQGTPPAAPVGSGANPYGVPNYPAQTEVGTYTPTTPVQPVQPVNPPAYPQQVPGYPSAPSVTPTPTASSSIGSGSGSSHVVSPGDSLWGISRKYGISVDALRQANGIAQDDSLIRSGQTLQIPGR